MGGSSPSRLSASAFYVFCGLIRLGAAVFCEWQSDFRHLVEAKRRDRDGHKTKLVGRPSTEKERAIDRGRW